MSNSNEQNIFVYFIGAGPGDPELITVKGQRLIEKADLILYAGSLVPRLLFANAKKEARIEDSASMTLEETHALLCSYAKNKQLALRVHTGDPALYGAVQEQRFLLEQEGIASCIVPGVSAAFAAAAAAGVSFTVPEAVQSFTITRLHGKTSVPEKQRIASYAQHKASLAIYLSGANPEQVQQELLEGGFAEDTTIIIASKVGWPGQRIISCTLSTLAQTSKQENIHRQVVFLVLPGEKEQHNYVSRLYAQDFSHGYRTKKSKE